MSKGDDRPRGPARRDDFVLVTGNRNKGEEARRIVGPTLEVAAIELPEIQSLDAREVLRAKAQEAWRRLERPLVVEETSLELAALGGFPGPLVKWMLRAAGAEGIARCAAGLGDTRAVARCLVLYFDGIREVVGEGIERGRLVLPPRGDTGFGWDVVFSPEGDDRTYAELGPEEKDARGHRGKAWRDLMRKL
ncbi:MAG TPA: non-canonical purine NTP pyrophosphatase [Thermoanaerobaculia bacterium]|nr:non-canonical purine NTP pyrophosphatase [Thermoanaerobaculia bacterium]